MEPNRFRHYIGIDWATEAHRICLLDHNGQLCAKVSIAHSGAGLDQLLEWLASHGVEPAFAAVAIETPRGALVETLVERHYAVFAINPKQLAHFRDRYTSAGAKDDDRDAWVAASALRTDEAAFQQVTIDAPELIQLRELYRTADELREEVQRLTSRLREQLIRYYPQMLALYPAPDQPVIWDLLELASLPATAHHLTLPQVAAVLQKRRIRRFTPGQVLEQLRATPLTLANGAAAAASEHALVLVAQLRVMYELRKQTLQRLASALKKVRQATTESGAPSDAAIIASLPGAGILTTAALLSESSRAVAQREAPALRAYAGVAPVTRQSGKTLQVSMRYPGFLIACAWVGRGAEEPGVSCGKFNTRRTLPQRVLCREVTAARRKPPNLLAAGRFAVPGPVLCPPPVRSEILQVAIEATTLAVTRIAGI